MDMTIQAPERVVWRGCEFWPVAGWGFFACGTAEQTRAMAHSLFDSAVMKAMVVTEPSLASHRERLVIEEG